jgi:hypothetical protein
LDYDRNEARRRRELEKALADKKKLEARFAELARKARTAKSRLLATTRHESWHRHALAWLDRDAGYDGEMASARVWLRSLPIHDYIAALAPYVEAMPNAPNIAIEVAAVRANLSDWTESGDALLLDRARREYAAELESFREWQRHNPDKKSWRNRPPTRTQLFLINRNATRLGIDAPFNLDRGDAHDWIEAHGGNRRLADTVVDEGQAPESVNGKTSTDVAALAAALDSVTAARIAATDDNASTEEGS